MILKKIAGLPPVDVGTYISYSFAKKNRTSKESKKQRSKEAKVMPSDFRFSLTFNARRVIINLRGRAVQNGSAELAKK